MKPDDFNFSTIYVFDKTIKDIFEHALLESFKKTVDWTMEASIVTMLHTGYGACYIGINPKLELAPKFKNEKSKSTLLLSNNIKKLPPTLMYEII